MGPAADQCNPTPKGPVQHIETRKKIMISSVAGTHRGTRSERFEEEREEARRNAILPHPTVSSHQLHQVSDQIKPVWNILNADPGYITELLLETIAPETYQRYLEEKRRDRTDARNIKVVGLKLIIPLGKTKRPQKRNFWGLFLLNNKQFLNCDCLYIEVDDCWPYHKKISYTEN